MTSSAPRSTIRGQNISLAKTRHGHARREAYSPEYRAWLSMIRRCAFPSQDSFAGYGGRGIAVADVWRGRDGFARFLEHVGRKPTAQHSLDRIDGSKGYEPGNVRWATMTEQQRNRSTNHLVTHNGRTQCVAAWAEELGLKQQTLLCRLRRGWSVEDALTQPLGTHVLPGRWGRDGHSRDTASKPPPSKGAK